MHRVSLAHDGGGDDSPIPTREPDIHPRSRSALLNFGTVRGLGKIYIYIYMKNIRASDAEREKKEGARLCLCAVIYVRVYIGTLPIKINSRPAVLLFTI